jgi:AraC-like DNA-binding protein
MPRRKLDPEQLVPCIPSQTFLLLLDIVEELGVRPERLCAGLACSVEDMRRGEEISYRQAWRMIRRALQLVGRADLGLEFGIRQNSSHFGLPGLAMSAASTLGDAIEICMNFPGRAGGVISPTLEQGDDHVTLIIDSNIHDISILPFVVEEFFASGVTVVRQLVGDGFHPSLLEVTYPEPAYSARYKEIFRCPVHFGGARNCARIEHSDLSLPIRTQSPELAAQRLLYLELEAANRALPPSPTVAVEQLLLRASHSKLSIDEVAGALQVSVRTLRRRLREDGSSFRALCNRIRADTAQRLLREQGMTVRAVARRLGFSDERTFRRAFKRWLGQVPGKIRPAAS